MFNVAYNGWKGKCACKLMFDSKTYQKLNWCAFDRFSIIQDGLVSKKIWHREDDTKFVLSKVKIQSLSLGYLNYKRKKGFIIYIHCFIDFATKIVIVQQFDKNH